MAVCPVPSVTGRALRTVVSVRDSVPATFRAGKNGGRLRSGNPGNKGGRRYKDDTIEALSELIAEEGPSVVAEIMKGRVKYHFTGHCSECGAESKGPTDMEGLLKAIEYKAPSPDTRLRSVEIAAKIAWGDKTTIEVVSPEVKERLLATIDVLVRTFGDDHPIIDAVSQVWG